MTGNPVVPKGRGSKRGTPPMRATGNSKVTPNACQPNLAITTSEAPLYPKDGKVQLKGNSERATPMVCHRSNSIVLFSHGRRRSRQCAIGIIHEMHES
jgi:hypothetical protein